MKNSILFLVMLLGLFVRPTYAQDDLQTAYEAALATIEDGQDYSIFTDVGGTKYYLTAEGYLTTKFKEAGYFTFEKVTGASSPAYEYGFLLNSQNDTRFSNPISTSEVSLTNGCLNTSTNNRVDWEAQVFFLKNDKFAVRATNSAATSSGWG